MKRMEFVHINGEGDLVNRANGSLVSYYEAQAEIEKRDKIILEQQARIKHYDEWLSDGVYFTNEEYRKEVAAINSTLEAHNREIRIKCLEEAANAKWTFLRQTTKNFNGSEIIEMYRRGLFHMADELKR